MGFTPHPMMDGWDNGVPQKNGTNNITLFINHKYRQLRYFNKGERPCVGFKEKLSRKPSYDYALFAPEWP